MRALSVTLVGLLGLFGCVSRPPASLALLSDDPCASGEDVSLTVGCNDGFAEGEPARGEPAGACASDAIEQGSCSEESVCLAGRCAPTCVPGTTFVSTGGCPSGFRCHDLGGGICLRDCDELHACPTGMTCASGICLPPL